MENNKIIFFGTSEFAVPTLQGLVKAGYEITVITTPDAPSGRDKVLTPSAIKLATQSLGLPVCQPKVLNIEELENCFKIYNLKFKIADTSVGVVAAYGKIIPKSIIGLFPRGILNIHPSLLPKYRGPSPIQTALLNGDTETGVTIMQLDEQVDHGAIMNSEKCIVDSQINYKLLETQLAELGAKLLIQTLPNYIAGKIEPQPQDDSQATFTKMITKEDGKINWHQDAEQIYNQFRAFHQWPGIWTIFKGSILKIIDCGPHEVQPRDERPTKVVLTPGTIFQENDHLFIPCQPGHLEILQLQLAGGKPITAKEFINGYGKLIENMV